MSKTTVNSSESIGYRELIRGNRNFRLLWLGQIISLLGDWFNFVASASLIAILTQSGFAVGSLFRRPYARPILHQSHRRRGRRSL